MIHQFSGFKKALYFHSGLQTGHMLLNGTGYKSVIKTPGLFKCSKSKSRIIYTRFCTKSAVLLRRIKKQKNKAEIKSRSQKPLAPCRKNMKFLQMAPPEKALPIGRSAHCIFHHFAWSGWNFARKLGRGGVPEYQLLGIWKERYLAVGHVLYFKTSSELATRFTKWLYLPLKWGLQK